MCVWIAVLSGVLRWLSVSSSASIASSTHGYQRNKALARRLHTNIPHASRSSKCGDWMCFGM